MESSSKKGNVYSLTFVLPCGCIGTEKLGGIQQLDIYLNNLISWNQNVKKNCAEFNLPK